MKNFFKEKNGSSAVKRLVVSALFTAMVAVATMIIKIPTPLKGYANIGDAAVLLSGWMLPAPYAFAAAAIGSALADFLLGYAVYIPTTFVIKGVMALIAFFAFRLLSKRIGSLVSWLIGAVTAELFMVGGYYLFEGVLYGFAPSLVNIPANAMQGVISLVIGILAVSALSKTKSILKKSN